MEKETNSQIVEDVTSALIRASENRRDAGSFKRVIDFALGRCHELRRRMSNANNRSGAMIIDFFIDTIGTISAETFSVEQRQGLDRAFTIFLQGRQDYADLSAIRIRLTEAGLVAPSTMRKRQPASSMAVQ